MRKYDQIQNCYCLRKPVLFSKKALVERPGNFTIFHDTENERPSRPALLSNCCGHPATGICITAMAASNSVVGKHMQVNSPKHAIIFLTSSFADRDILH